MFHNEHEMICGGERKRIIKAILWWLSHHRYTADDLYHYNADMAWLKCKPSSLKFSILIISNEAFCTQLHVFSVSKLLNFQFTFQFSSIFSSNINFSHIFFFVFTHRTFIISVRKIVVVWRCLLIRKKQARRNGLLFHYLSSILLDLAAYLFY